MLLIMVTAANVTDRDAAKELLFRLALTHHAGPASPPKLELQKRLLRYKTVQEQAFSLFFEV
ncbi:hypothetical protein EJ357_02355 [Streptomyces cyaneochromogenes]|uniref:Uncharacterized protein n=1 Tax=Streptomyces cyaneochromogenes TaxID=2496836 RepID=A0A3S9M031_9ACTN|nr:hypothetical protein [Streptomyces cyaneochromogenes]AZQ32430.1 hypothetical protein EJ357_02355 [Streptomyces cyaneochromogenes]